MKKPPCYCCGARPTSDLTLYTGVALQPGMRPSLLVVSVGSDRAAVLCQPCFDAWDVDMWINESRWRSGPPKPQVSYERLPHMRGYDASQYPDPDA